MSKIIQLLKFTLLLPAVLAHESCHYLVAKVFGLNPTFHIPVSISDIIAYQMESGAFQMPDTDNIRTKNQWGVDIDPNKRAFIGWILLYHLAPTLIILPIYIQMISVSTINLVMLFASIQFIFALAPSLNDYKGVYKVLKQLG